MRELEPNSVDSIVTDPPYGWRFMGKAWDAFDIAKKGIDTRSQKHEGEWRIGSDGKRRRYGKLNVPNTSAGSYDTSLTGNQSFQIFTEGWATQAYRVLKPGGHMLVFCGPRTYHRMASGVEDAGFEIRDQLQWLFGSGFPKSHNIGNGIGTALKPANEPIVLARKPFDGTVASNVAKWGVGGLNIDESRIGTEDNLGRPVLQTQSWKNTSTAGVGSVSDDWKKGRWPANVLFDEEAAEMLDEQSGVLKNGGQNKTSKKINEGMFFDGRSESIFAGDSGGASRFFYCAKASKSERNAGLEGMPKQVISVWGGEDDDLSHGKKATIPTANHHPTVKPIKLMQYLIKLITPPNGVVLDPFMGSGSTGVAAKQLGFEFIGLEMNEEYIEIAKRRIDDSQRSA